MSWCLSTRTRTSSRDEATIVQKSIRAVVFGAIRTRRRSAKIGSSTAPVAPESGRPPILRPAHEYCRPRSNEFRTIGLELAIARRFAVDNRQVRSPHLRLRGCPPPLRRQYGTDAGEVFGLGEQFRECRVSHVCGLGRQNQFGVGSHLDLSRLVAEFEIVTRRTSASSSADTST